VLVAAAQEWETLMRPAKQRIERSMTVTLLDFYADWCGPCKTQDPILDDLEEDWEGRFEVEKVNVDEQQDVANEYQVRSLPTLIIENDDGVVERFVGVTQREDLESALEQAGA
jgi:thioredoxin 1